MRMQRGGYSESVQEAGLIEDFERVQKQYDIFTLQEELKQMVVENSLLKERTLEIQERFRRVEEKREGIIKSLGEKLEAHENKKEKQENW